ncbi:MAG: DUF2637 domain-containing protein [Actinobacteria bacterium]|nr:DUF2637 domain-containing protein [Actinomycetota bacterium]
MSDRMTRILTTGAVLLVAAIAAGISFIHIEDLAITHGQSAIAAAGLPLSIDGTVVAASMVMLRAARQRMPTPWLARVMLGASVAATLAANVAYGARFGATGALLSGWPAAAFIGSAEMALGMTRRAARKAAPKATPEASPRATVKPPAKAARKPVTAGPEAAAEAAAKAIGEGQPVPSARALAREFKISRDTAGKVLAGFNGHAKV